MKHRFTFCLFLVVLVSSSSCNDDDSQDNYFAVGNDTRRVALVARIGNPVPMENALGKTFYRQQIAFWDDGHTYANNVVTGDGQILTLWLNMTTEELQPNNYIVQEDDTKGSWGQIDRGTWTVPSTESEPLQELPILPGSYLKIQRTGDTYSIALELKVPTKQEPAVLKGFYYGEPEMIQK